MLQFYILTALAQSNLVAVVDSKIVRPSRQAKASNGPYSLILDCNFTSLIQLGYFSREILRS